jgi:hypothetical protein
VRVTLPATAYRTLTPEERFRLLLAAGGRDDDAERDRLVGASPRVGRSLPDYYPYSQAFQELTLQTYMELHELAAQLLETLALTDACEPDDVPEDEEVSDAPSPYPPDSAEAEPSEWERHLELAFVAGYILKTKTAGWAAFCDRLSVPPLLLWTAMPGYDRLERAWKVSEKVAYDAEGFGRWRDRMRQKRDPDGSGTAAADMSSPPSPRPTKPRRHSGSE